MAADEQRARRVSSAREFIFIHADGADGGLSKLERHKTSVHGAKIGHQRREVRQLKDVRKRKSGSTTVPPRPWTWYNDITIDPLLTNRHNDLFDTRHAISFLVGYVAPAEDVMCKIFDICNNHTYALLDYLRSNPDALYAFCALMQAIMGRSSNEILRSKGMALDALRKRLAKPHNDDEVLLTVSVLALLEDAMNDRAAYVVHASSLNSLASIRGGTKNLLVRPFMQRYVDSAMLADQPEVQEAYFVKLGTQAGPTMSLLPDQIAILNSDHTPTGLRELYRQGLIQTSTSVLISRIVRALQQRIGEGFTHIKYHKPHEMAVDIPRVGFDDDRAQFSVDPALCLTVGKFVHQRIYGLNHDVCYGNRFATMLARYIPRIVVPASGELRRCCIWIYVVTAYAVGQTWPPFSRYGSPVLKWLAFKIPEVVEMSEEDVIDLGLTYFWDMKLTEMVRQHWHVATGGMATKSSEEVPGAVGRTSEASLYHWKEIRRRRPSVV